MTSVRAKLVSLAVVSVLLYGCGPGKTVPGAGLASVANPHLQGTGPPEPVPSSAAGVARAIAARWAAAGIPAAPLKTPIKWRTIDYTATVFNPGSAGGFTAFTTTRRTILVTPASAAVIHASNGAPAGFATPVDKALWQAAGRPTLGQVPAAGQVQAIPAGRFTFLPQGSNLTYHQAAVLPAESGLLATVIQDHLRAYAGSHPPASLELKQMAYLIASAPLSDSARSAAWQVLAALPRLHFCQTRSGRAPPSTAELCADSTSDEILVSVDVDTGAILTIADRLLRASPLYPHVAAGTVVGLATFPAPTQGRK